MGDGEQILTANGGDLCAASPIEAAQKEHIPTEPGAFPLATFQEPAEVGYTVRRSYARRAQR